MLYINSFVHVYSVCVRVRGLVLKYPLHDTHQNTQTPILKCAFKNNGPRR